MSVRPRVLLLGASGRLGRELLPALSGWADVVAAGRDAEAVLRADLGEPASLRAAVEREHWACVVNAAGATNVDAVESDPAAAQAANVNGPAALAQACARRGALLAHWSTDYVFGGAGAAPYREQDAPAPVNVYGRQKLAAEEAVRAAGGPHLILRTAWLFARGVPGWLEAMRATLAAGGSVSGVVDQRGSPTWTRTAAQACSAALQRLVGVGPAGDLSPADVGGTYHVVSSDGASWREIADELRRAVGTGSVRSITRAERDVRAPRPADTRLDASRFTARFGAHLSPWREALARCLRDAGR